jgi:hypothetical protein
MEVMSDFWPGVEAGMDLDAILLQAAIVLVGVGTLWALMLYANDRDEETGSRSLTVSDLKRFGSLSLLDKMFVMLVVTLVLGIAGGIAVLTLSFVSR